MARKTQGLGTITREKRKKGWYYRAQIAAGLKEDGTPYRPSKASYNKQEVIDWLKEWNNKNLTPNSEKTLSEVAHKWLEEVKKPTVAQKTYEKYESKIRLYIDPDPISEMIISQITIDQLQYYITKLEKKEGNSIAKEVLSIIRSIFTRMHELGEIPANYAKFVKITVTNKTVGSRKKKPLTHKQREALLKELDLTNKVDLAIYLAFFSGLRQGEVLGLTHEDIGYTEIDVNKSWTRIEGATFGIKSPKNETSVRSVPIPINAMKEIREHTKNDQGFIFSDNGKKPFNVNRIQRRMAALGEIIGAKLCFHLLRHTYATILFEQGIKPKIVQTLLGHKSLETTMEIYVEVTNEVQRESVQSLNHMAL